MIHRESDYFKIYSGISKEILDEIIASLPACSCGGSFTQNETPKCVHCGAPFPDKRDVMQRASDPHMTVVDGACVFSDKQETYQVKILEK